MSGYFARLAQRSGDATFTHAPDATPASSAYDAAPAGEETSIELERSETIEAKPTASPAVMSSPDVPASSASAAEPPTQDIAPSVPARNVVEEIVEHRQAKMPRQTIGQPDRSAVSARAHGSSTASEQTSSPRAQSVAAAHLSNPHSPETPSRLTAVAAASPNDARTESALSAPEPHASAQIEMHQTVDPMLRARGRASTSHSTATSLSHMSSQPPTPSPARGGVEVSIGRIEIEITAAAPPPPAAVSAELTRAPRPAPAFNPHRYYLRGG